MRSAPWECALPLLLSAGGEGFGRNLLPLADQDGHVELVTLGGETLGRLDPVPR